MPGLTYLRDVVTLELDKSKCNGCGTCLKVCPHAVMARDGKVVRVANRDDCMECGACARNCEPGAISVQSGVGCAAAILGTVMGSSKTPCCGPVDPDNPTSGSCCC